MIVTHNRITLQYVDPMMIANNLTSSEPTHPGELMKDELEARHMSQAVLARLIGISPTQLNEMIHGKRAVNTETALLLEAAWGIEADLWIHLQADYDKHITKSNQKVMERLTAIQKAATFL